MIREQAIETLLRTEVKKFSGQCLKWVSPGLRGVPDRIVFWPMGFIVFVELKAAKGRLSANQKRAHELLRTLGHEVVVLKSKEEVKSWVELQASVLGFKYMTIPPAKNAIITNISVPTGY